MTLECTAAAAKTFHAFEPLFTLLAKLPAPALGAAEVHHWRLCFF
jgi:hypothetical protein|tara:strand:+ start:290 stop:424 length:135 start_codon:yes stop_codon:yes gene_type:complete